MNIFTDTEIAKILIPAISAISASVLTLLFNRKKLRHDVEDQFRDDIIAELNTLRNEVKYWTEKYYSLADEYSKLSSDMKLLERDLTMKIALFESAHSDLPLPMWLKDPDGKMLSLNDAYEFEFLKPFGLTKDDYIGKYDTDVWPKEISEEYYENDRKVYLTGETWEGVEMVARPDSGIVEEWQIVKYLRQSSGVKIGIGGIAIKMLTIKPLDEAMEEKGRKIRDSDKASVSHD